MAVNGRYELGMASTRYIKDSSSSINKMGARSQLLIDIIMIQNFVQVSGTEMAKRADARGRLSKGKMYFEIRILHNNQPCSA